MPSIVQLQRQPSKLRRLERFAYVVTAITIIILVVFMSRLFMVSDGNFSEEGHLEREKLSLIVNPERSLLTNLVLPIS